MQPFTKNSLTLVLLMTLITPTQSVSMQQMQISDQHINLMYGALGLSAATALGITGYRLVTRGQDEAVRMNNETKLNSTHIPNIKQNLNLHFDNGNIQDAEKNTASIFQQICHPSSSGYHTKQIYNCDTKAVIKKDRKEVESMQTNDLWFRSLFNEKLSEQRKKLMKAEQDIDEVDAFTTNHNLFYTGWKTIKHAEDHLVSSVTADNIAQLPLMANKSRRVFDYVNSVKTCEPKLATIGEYKQYPFLAHRARNHGTLLYNLKNQALNLPAYEYELAEFKLEEKEKSLQKQQAQNFALERQRVAIEQQKADAQKKEAQLRQAELAEQKKETRIKDYKAHYKCTDDQARVAINNEDFYYQLGTGLGQAFGIIQQ